ncbi:hypothetical protein Tco_0474478 [Tanacetum coccineum]
MSITSAKHFFDSEPSINESFVIELVKVTNLNEIGNVSVRIGSDSPIKLIIPNHFHLGTLDMEMIGNRELDYSGTRSWCNVPSARPHRLVIGINDGF